MEKKRNLWVITTDKPSRLRIGNNGNFVIGLAQSATVSKNDSYTNQNIYITSYNADINENDYIITKDGRLVEVSYLLSKDLEGASKIILTTDVDLNKDGVQAIDDEFLEWFVKNSSCEKVNVNGISDVALGGFADVCYKIIIPRTTEQIIDEDYAGGLEMGQIIPKEEAKQDLEKEMFELEQELDIPSHLRWHNSKAKQETLEEVIGKQFQLNSSTEIKDEKYVYLIDKHRFKIAVNNILKWQQERMYSEEDMKSAFKVGFSIGYGSDVYAIDEKNRTCEEWFEQFKKK